MKKNLMVMLVMVMVCFAFTGCAKKESKEVQETYWSYSSAENEMNADDNVGLDTVANALTLYNDKTYTLTNTKDAYGYGIVLGCYGAIIEGTYTAGEEADGEKTITLTPTRVIYTATVAAAGWAYKYDSSVTPENGYVDADGNVLWASSEEMIKTVGLGGDITCDLTYYTFMVK